MLQNYVKNFKAQVKSSSTGFPKKKKKIFYL